MAHFINSEDCMGNPERYWRAGRTASDGKCVLGTGGTEQEAEAAADANLRAHEAKLEAMDRNPREVLHEILAKQHWSGGDAERAIRCIAQLI